ncbi:hypothetical protein [Altericista sp. CCNU0014]|uniref:hypothetical protein n=1 Tax=Altericista sp. CCNU0014 TaxID=3082949 RepID=UPI00384A67C5
MLSPNDLIGQQVWIEIPVDRNNPRLEVYRIKATLTQPTSPPWFYARFDSPPAAVRDSGQWLSLKEAQDAFLYDPVLEDYDDLEEDWNDWADEEDELNLK